jgi:hypothetical protein
MKLSTPTGASIAPTPEGSQPVSATGQTLTALVDTTITVEPGVYALTSAGGYALVGWATTDTAANVLFICPAGRTIIIHVPEGVTHLHYRCV